MASEISIDQFGEVELKVGTVLEAEPIEKSDKLIKMKIDVGEIRQVVAGIRKWYAPENLIGKQVIVVCNLKPVKLRGVESQGMVLCASTEDRAVLLEPSEAVPNGTKIR